MTAEWRDLSPDRSEYRKTDENKTLIGRVVRVKNGFRGEYLRGDKVWGLTELKSSLASAKWVVEGMVANPDVERK
jgi:hypothetical protein